ncbi:MAG TPA: hypothetical protein EYQ74_04040 [Planctomycetes bacterium]|nr:hypothetical protein [Planctomycetota bacterium]HIK60312.1 hypothetical protein [Planctomycetota bacterium]
MNTPVPRLLFAAPLLLLVGCQTTPKVNSGWWQETAADLGTKLGGCSMGDLDSAHPGQEIGVVAEDGRVYCLRRESRGWAQEEVAHLQGEQIQCLACDLFPNLPGDELVTVGVAVGSEGDGGAGVAWVHWKQAGRWRSERILTDTALFHALAFGDVDPRHAGAELILAGFSGRVHVLRRGDGELVSESFGPLPGNAKGAAVGLGGVVLACDDGSLCAMRRAESGWQLEVLDRFSTALARVSARRDRALVCANDGRLRLIDEEGVQAIPVSSQALRGAVFGEFDPLLPGEELATAGYDGRVRVLVLRDAVADDPARGIRSGDRVVQETLVGRDDDRLHHLASGSLAGLGNCLVACGYSGRVIVMSRLD